MIRIINTWYFSRMIRSILGWRYYTLVRLSQRNLSNSSHSSLSLCLALALSSKQSYNVSKDNKWETLRIHEWRRPLVGIFREFLKANGIHCHLCCKKNIVGGVCIIMGTVSASILDRSAPMKVFARRFGTLKSFSSLYYQESVSKSRLLVYLGFSVG